MRESWKAFDRATETGNEGTLVQRIPPPVRGKRGGGMPIKGVLLPHTFIIFSLELLGYSRPHREFWMIFLGEFV